MAKGKAREWTIYVRHGKVLSGPSMDAEAVLVREVIELTDEEKERIQYLKRIPSPSEAYLIGLLERAGVIE